MAIDELQFRNSSFENGLNTFKSGMGNLFGGVSKLSNVLTNPLFEAGCQISAISMSPSYQMTNAMRCYGAPGWGWGWGCYCPPLFPFAFPPTVDYWYSPGVYQIPMPQYQDYSYSAMNSSSYQYTPESYSSFYKSSGDDFRVLNEILHPERQNNGASGNTGTTTSTGATTSTGTTTETIELRDKNGNDVTPNWYSDTENRKSKGEKVSAPEERLCNNFKKLTEKYSLYQYDKDKKPVTDANGNLKPSAFYNKLADLQAKIDSHDSNGIERVLNACSAEELAAIETMYPLFLNTLKDKGLPNSSAMTFREAVKDACLWTWCGWTGINTAQCERIFDTLDKGLTADPRAMANALYQAIKNHHSFFGMKWGIDDDRIVKLLKMTNGDKAFIEAVKEEYSKKAGCPLDSDINSSWTTTSANKEIISKYL